MINTIKKKMANSNHLEIQPNSFENETFNDNIQSNIETENEENLKFLRDSKIIYTFHVFFHLNLIIISFLTYYFMIIKEFGITKIFISLIFLDLLFFSFILKHFYKNKAILKL